MEIVKLTYPPESILAYAKKILADAEKTQDASNPEDRVPVAQILMLKDIVKLVELAQKAMTPAAKPKTDNQNN